MEWLYPIVTGRTFFDGPSIIHFCFWVYAGSIMAYGKMSLGRAMWVMVAMAYAWEVFERFAEKAYPQYWQHPESWWNSYISDPLMGVLGVLLVYWLVRHQ